MNWPRLGPFTWLKETSAKPMREPRRTSKEKKKRSKAGRTGRCSSRGRSEQHRPGLGEERGQHRSFAAQPRETSRAEEGHASVTVSPKEDTSKKNQTDPQPRNKKVRERRDRRWTTMRYVPQRATPVGEERGRPPTQQRRLFAQTGVCSRADGSAFVECEGSKVLAAVYGPRATTKVRCLVLFVCFLAHRLDADRASTANWPRCGAT